MQTHENRRFLSTLALLIGMMALEALLLRIAGPPSSHLRVLAGLVSPMAEPLEGMLAALALAAEALAAHLVGALALRTLAHLPGFVGQLADRAERMLTVPAVRRALDALLGSAMLAHLALVPPSTEAVIATTPVHQTALTTTTTLGERSSCPGLPQLTRTGEGRETGTAASRVAPSPIPLPIWLGGGPAPPSTANDPGRPRAGTASAHHAVEIEPGDTLWGIAAAELPAGLGGDSMIARYWRRIYGVNRGALGADPNRIRPGVTLSIPPYLPSRTEQ